MCQRQEQCVTIRDISFLRFLREAVEMRRFEGNFRLLSPENAGKVSMKLHVSHPTDRIPHESDRHNLLFNPLNPELNPICYLVALLAHHFLHVSRIRVKSFTIKLLMSYIYMEHLFLMFLDHTQRRSTVGRTPLDE